jgi:hypothetical protein
MPASTPSFAIPYPLPDDSVADYPGVGLDLAETVDSLFKAPGCRVRSSVDQACAVNATTTLNFDVEEWDADGMHAAASPSRLTAVRAGFYYVSLAGIVGATVVAANYVRLRHNGNPEFDHTLTFSAPMNLTVRFTMSALFRCAVGDYLDAAVYQAGGGAVLNYAASGSRFGACWIGP